MLAAHKDNVNMLMFYQEMLTMFTVLVSMLTFANQH